MDFGRAILSIRKHLNKSQAELSANLGVDQSYLSQIENNKRSLVLSYLNNFLL